MYGAKRRIRLFIFHFELVRARCIASCRKRIHVFMRMNSIYPEHRSEMDLCRVQITFILAKAHGFKPYPCVRSASTSPSPSIRIAVNARNIMNNEKKIALDSPISIIITFPRSAMLRATAIHYYYDYCTYNHLRIEFWNQHRHFFFIRYIL